MNKSILGVCAAALTSIGVTANADISTRADSHAPIGVMADHFHKAGEWMFSYRFMTMDMAGNRAGSKRIDADTIVTTSANPFSGLPGMPPTLRVVPTDMDMDMHMFGAMYAPTDRVTLMLMGSYQEKSMNHVTYMGGAGTTILGNFRTKSSDWGDTTVGALFSLVHGATSRVHAIVGLSLPTASTDETGQVLSPTNMRPVLRLPYPMQNGSGSFDPMIGASYSGFANRFSWGGQWRGTFRVDKNDEGYRLGDEHRLTGWGSYLVNESVSGSLRFEYYDRGNVRGTDPLIMAPVQTADPKRQGLTRIEAAVGFNFLGTGVFRGWRLGLEYVVPVRQDLDGPQLETDSQLIVGLQRSVK